jgi:hypothetical protein
MANPTQGDGSIKTMDLKLDVPGVQGRVDATFTAPPRIADRVVCLVLGHGIMNDKDHPLLRDLGAGLAHGPFCSLRFNYPYKQRGSRQVDNRAVLLDTFKAAIAWTRMRLADHETKLVIGGKSLSARMAAALQAQEPLADGMVYLGYPLHKPDSQERLRDEDLYKIIVPQLFAAGEKDPYCHLELLRGVCNRLQGPWELTVIEDAGHSLGVSMEGSDLTSRSVINRLAKKMTDWGETLLQTT